MNRIDLSGRTAIVAGGAQGTALAVAQAISASGGNVMLAMRSQEAANAAAATVGGNAVGVAARAVDQAAAQRCVEAAVDRFGGVDILVNAFGNNHAHGRVVDQDYLRFTKTLGVNLWAPILWTSVVTRVWMSEHGGVVINTLDGTGPAGDRGLYGASNAALIQLTAELAVELSPTVRVNAVAVGIAGFEHAGSATTLTRTGEADEVGDVVASLASDAESWVPGQTLVFACGCGRSRPHALGSSRCGPVDVRNTDGNTPHSSSSR
ncbi:SDR family oxidoreductase [Nocardia fluminea]|uniref:NAD(P)-dependent dehydrogenase (Short-subunit alcohol dehydrogenase family) n=1 Tax=Nocardia fluminea TaxID=134984 RepID=A0A2N3VK98_9NOCA|nr:SDR family oxidoreductase [Nocardia fluminea]PKV82045.1 NAD(P)-dependent dehydrogenase (short-subunit alcohol dehydrogenase family) [Nocardia fluminea]